MRIWFIEIGEPLPLEKGKRLLRYGRFTAFLAAKGHDVSWWACDFSHAVKSHVAEAKTHVLDNGVKLHVLHGPGYQSNVSFARFQHHRVVAKELKRSLAAHASMLPDIIICPVPTVENARVVADFAKKHNVPYILDIRDHWPEDLVNRFPKLVRPAARILLNGQFRDIKRAAQQAKGISGVTKLQMHYGLKFAGRDEDKTRDYVFYLGYTRTPLSAPMRNEANQWWQQQGLKTNVKIIAFAGTLGISFDFAPVLAAARRLRDQGRSDIQFVIAGDGDARAGLMRGAGDMLGTMVLMPGWIDQPKIDALMSISTAALAPYIPGTSMSLPNKFFEYMAYGLPVLSSCTGESEELIQAHRIGVQYDAGQMESFMNALLQITDAPDAAKAMGDAALHLFDTRFEQNRLFTNMEAHMTQLVKA
ncbi:MAG TPA: glycosyltransferase family 4 protein [Alphaproteobacteria bacterium]